METELRQKYNLFKRDHYECKQLAGIIHNQCFLELMMFLLHAYFNHHNINYINKAKKKCEGDIR